MLREKILENFYRKIERREPILISAPGIGLLGKMHARNGIDMELICASSRFNIDGRPSLTSYLAYSDSNTLMLDMGKRALMVNEGVPVMAGIASMDPYRSRSHILEEIEHMGFCGVANAPTAAIMTDIFESEEHSLHDRKVMLGVYEDISLIKDAHERNLFTMGFGRDEEEIEMLVRAGADIVCPHMGFTQGGNVGVPKNCSYSLEDACKRTQQLCRLAKNIRPDIIVAAHGGPFYSFESVKKCFETTDVDGFYGNSVFGRIPIETAITKTVCSYLDLPLKNS